MKLEGDLFPGLFKLTAIPFKPPTPSSPAGEIDYDDYPAIRIMFMNVSEPRLYRDENNIVFVVLPAFADIDYEMVSDAHPIHDEWCYRLSPYDWDEDSALVAAEYIFRDDILADFDISDVMTH